MSKSQAIAAAASSARRYTRFFEYGRVVSNVIITDEGVYQEGQIPDTYGGAQLSIQCVHAVLMVNAKAELVIFEFEVDSPMDKERKSGGPIYRDGVLVREKVGTSTVPVVQTTILNANLDPARQTLGAMAKAQFSEDLAKYPSQPKS